MLDDSTNKFAIILRNEDLQNYAGDAFYNLVKAVTIHDTGAAVDGIKDVKDFVFYIHSSIWIEMTAIPVWYFQML